MGSTAQVASISAKHYLEIFGHAEVLIVFLSNRFRPSR
jgi:hypothetical protein